MIRYLYLKYILSLIKLFILSLLVLDGATMIKWKRGLEASRLGFVLGTCSDTMKMKTFFCWDNNDKRWISLKVVLYCNVVIFQNPKLKFRAIPNPPLNIILQSDNFTFGLLSPPQSEADIVELFGNLSLRFVTLNMMLL